MRFEADFTSLFTTTSLEIKVDISTPLRFSIEPNKLGIVSRKVLQQWQVANYTLVLVKWNKIPAGICISATLMRHSIIIFLA